MTTLVHRSPLVTPSRILAAVDTTPAVADRRWMTFPAGAITSCIAGSAASIARTSTVTRAPHHRGLDVQVCRSRRLAGTVTDPVTGTSHSNLGGLLGAVGPTAPISGDHTVPRAPRHRI